MNKKEIIRKHYNQYSPNSDKGQRYKTCKKNAVLINSKDTIKHELSKSIGAIMIHKYGDVKFDNNLIEKINIISEYISEILFSKWDENHTDFITEAWPNTERRVDLVNLRTNDHIEFETNKKIKKDDAVTIYI